MNESNFTTLNVIVLTATLLVLIWYTYETRKLRLVAERDSKYLTRPLVIVDFKAGSVSQGIIDDDADVSDVQIVCMNIGGETALNVRFRPVNELYEGYGRVIKFRIPGTRVLVPGDTKRVAISEFENEERVRGGHPHEYLIPGMVINESEPYIRYDISPESSHWKNHSYMIAIEYSDKFGNSFTTQLVVDKNGISIDGGK